jgi:hypothetical protein
VYCICSLLFDLSLPDNAFHRSRGRLGSRLASHRDAARLGWMLELPVTGAGSGDLTPSIAPDAPDDVVELHVIGARCGSVLDIF